ncbi:transporter [Natrinema versiforme JCM 10478]|uniref:Transporter n=2 Tax=Natrinema versiforme TaxID=88724 RepID=L9XZR7_9EURY|nr:transporter [Natrinema versiforme JCM 10478]
MRYLRRIGVVIAVMILFGYSMSIYRRSRIHEHPTIAIIVLVLWAGALIIGAHLLFRSTRLRFVEHSSVGLLLVSTTVFALGTIYIVSPTHLGSDVPLFTRYAAMQVLEGVNPYQIPFDGVHELLRHNEYVSTPKRDGTHVVSLSYPAFSFLAYVPVVWMGLDVRLLGAVILFPIVVLLIYWYAPDEWGVIPVLPLFANQGFLNTVVVDYEMLWVLPLMLAAMFWYRDLDLSAVWFGITCAAKQNPWLIGPFIVLRFVFGADDYRTGLKRSIRYGGISSIVFLIPNVPFLISSPEAWFQGVFTPIAGEGAPLIFYGQGLAALSWAGLVPIAKSAYSYVLLGGLAFAAIAYVLYLDELKDVMWVVPMLLMFLNYRGSQKYYTMLLPIAIIVIISMYRYQGDDADTSPEVEYA